MSRAAKEAAQGFRALEAQEFSEDDALLGKNAAQKSFKEKMLIPVVFVLFVLIRAMDRIFLYRVQKSMQNYTGIVMSLYWPPMVQLMCFFVSLGYLARKRYLDGDKSFNMRWFSPFSPRASSQGPVPQCWIAQFAFWDQLNAIVSAPPGPFIPMVLQTPLNNLNVLFTAFIAFFYLKTRYRMVHYSGISLILCACLVGVVVELQGPAPILCTGLKQAKEAMGQSSVAALVPESVRATVTKASDDCVIGLPPYKNAQGELVHVNFGILLFMYALFIVAIIPSAFSNCYKQKKLKQVNLDVMWSFFWAGMWQVIWGFLMFPLNWIPWPEPGGKNEQSPSKLGGDLADSWTCFMGTNPKPEVTSCDAEPAYVWFGFYLLFNVFFNLFFLWLIKRLSGTWAAIGSILCGNLCGIFSQYEIFAGPSARKLTMEQWLALVLSSIAMWVYNIEEETDVDGNSVYAEKPKGDHRYDEHGPMGLDPESDYESEDEPEAESHGNF